MNVQILDANSNYCCNDEVRTEIQGDNQHWVNNINANLVSLEINSFDEI